MKKLLISLVVVAASLLGLGATSVSPADATVCPYSGCVATRTSLTAPRIHRPGPVTFRVAVTTRSGNGRPQGHVRLTCTGPGLPHSKTVFYRAPRRIVMTLWTRGRWHCTASFSSSHKWRSSRASRSLSIVR